MDASYAPGIDGRPREADTTKPDPDEPWRFVCPDCGRQPTDRASGAKFWCESCEESLEKADLKDLKQQ